MTSRSSIACFATYRPPVALDIFSRPLIPSEQPEVDEVLLSDGRDFYNQNCRAIPALALKELLTFLGRKNPKLASEYCGASPDDAETGRVTGVVFVSERDNGLETLHVALRFTNKVAKVLSLADIYGEATFGGVRMEDSGCFAGGFRVGSATVGHSLIYVSTKQKPAEERRTPWTVVYRTNLADGKTDRLTPKYQYDLSPAVSPSGEMVAVANFRWNKWTGEIEKLKTHIAVMNVDRKAQGGLDRVILIKDGGWPTWGSDNVIFFHRGIETTHLQGDNGKTTEINWGVFRYDIITKQTVRVTPESANAMTPAAISETKVAVAIIREHKTTELLGRKKHSHAHAHAHGRKQMEHYRHIEIFDTAAPEQPPVRITQGAIATDHYNPSVLDCGTRIGYHRCRTDKPGVKHARKIQKLETPPSHSDVGLFSLQDAFAAISSDGSKLAFVDNEFKALWLADTNGMRVLFKRSANKIFSVAWNPDPEKDTLYVCEGPSFSTNEEVAICALRDVSNNGGGGLDEVFITLGGFNDAFPSCNPDGTQLVFRSTRDRSTGNMLDDRKHKNLYILPNAVEGEAGGQAIQLTDGAWTDTHCRWSPTGDWIVFSSTRHKPKDDVPPLDNGLDPGYFAVYLVKATDRHVIRVVTSAAVTIAGHVNHPVFSPDGRRIAFTSDLAAVSADPISLPLFLHSVRPYGDIFAVDIDMDMLDGCAKRKQGIMDIDEFHRLTHSRYEYSMPEWTHLAVDHPAIQWKLATMLEDEGTPSFKPSCPYNYKHTAGRTRSVTHDT
uniref:Uncharacterized protein n=1 Tax=Avena sativa TaxID=4498 RepID=A0ACD5TSH5_AVESA